MLISFIAGLKRTEKEELTQPPVETSQMTLKSGARDG